MATAKIVRAAPRKTYTLTLTYTQARLLTSMAFCHKGESIAASALYKAFDTATSGVGDGFSVYNANCNTRKLDVRGVEDTVFAPVVVAEGKGGIAKVTLELSAAEGLELLATLAPRTTSTEVYCALEDAGL